jgi:NTE family protein
LRLNDPGPGGLIDKVGSPLNFWQRRPVVGLALGGGGARGLAHIGVLKVLEEAGIAVNCLSGTSMGGLIAAAAAAGLSVSKMEALALKMGSMREWVSMVGLLPSRRGLLDANKVRAFLLETFAGDPHFAGLQVPLALSAVDLDRGEEVVLAEGSLAQAVMATIAVPGLFPPVEKGGQRLIDGGVLNNVPANLLRKMGAQVVLAVDVGPSSRWDETWAGPELPSPLSALLPRLILDFYQTEMIMVAALTRAKLREARPEVLIRPDLGPEITLLTGFAHARTIIDAGERAARESLPEIREAIRPSVKWRLRRG